MKTTLDLPDDLVRKLKLRAVRDGRKLKDIAADMLRTGLAVKTTKAIDEPIVIIKDKKTGLPVIQCRRAAPKGRELTPERVAEILIEQEAGWRVILVDTNVWLALALSRHEFHKAAHDWYARQKEARSVLFCRSTQQSFLRLLTTEAVMRAYDLPAMSNSEAWLLCDGFLSDPRSGFAQEPDNVESRWKKYAERKTASPKLWMDAYLAAFAMEGKYKFLTMDKAFSQFKDLELVILSSK